jgi:hypothetical protein
MLSRRDLGDLLFNTRVRVRDVEVGPVTQHDQVTANDAFTLLSSAPNTMATFDAGHNIVSKPIENIILPTTNQISVSPSGNNTVTLSTPQDINTTSDPTFHSLLITSSVDTTSASTGALVVSGGVGVANNLNIGGGLVTNGPIGVRLFNTGASSAYIRTNSAGDLVLQSAVSNSATINGLKCFGNLRLGNSSDPFISSTLSVDTNGYLNVTSTGSNAIINDALNITNTTSASSTSSGAVVVLGGVSIAKNLIVNQATQINITTSAISTATGALIVGGGIGIGGNVYAGGSVYTSSAYLGASPTALQWYSVASLNTTWTGALTSAVTAYCVRVGDLVHLSIPYFTSTATGTGALITNSALSAPYRPISNTVWTSAVATRAGTNSACLVQVTTAGIIQCYSDMILGGWTLGQPMALSVQISYYLQ